MKQWLMRGAIACLIAVGQSGYAYDHVQIARDNMPAVVAVNVLRKDGSTFTGTGFILTEQGLLATSQHVLKDALYTNLTFNNTTVSGEAVCVAQDPQLDIALLKIQAQQLPHVWLADNDEVQPGQVITVIGNPRRLQNTVTSGIISQVRRQKDGSIWHQISAPISPSSSGSPVFDEQGRVIAMAFASVTGEGNQNLNFAIPASYIKQLAAKEGLSLPDKKPEPLANPFWRHIQKSWQITKQLWRQWWGEKPAISVGNGEKTL